MQSDIFQSIEAMYMINAHHTLHEGNWVFGFHGGGSNDELTMLFQKLDSATWQLCIPAPDVASRKTREIASRVIQKHVGPCLLSLLLKWHKKQSPTKTPKPPWLSFQSLWHLCRLCSQVYDQLAVQLGVKFYVFWHVCLVNIKGEVQICGIQEQ
jgi:hypothetical protein